jgi:hypothetical protein
MAIRNMFLRSAIRLGGLHRRPAFLETSRSIQSRKSLCWRTEDVPAMTTRSIIRRLPARCHRYRSMMARRLSIGTRPITLDQTVHRCRHSLADHRLGVLSFETLSFEVLRVRFSLRQVEIVLGHDASQFTQVRCGGPSELFFSLRRIA